MSYILKGGLEESRHCFGVNALASLPRNPNHLFSAGRDSAIFLWDVSKQPQHVRSFLQHTDWVNDIFVTEDGNHRTLRPPCVCSQVLNALHRQSYPPLPTPPSRSGIPRMAPACVPFRSVCFPLAVLPASFVLSHAGDRQTPITSRRWPTLRRARPSPPRASTRVLDRARLCSCPEVLAHASAAAIWLWDMEQVCAIAGAPAGSEDWPSSSASPWPTLSFASLTRLAWCREAGWPL